MQTTQSLQLVRRSDFTEGKQSFLQNQKKKKIDKTSHFEDFPAPRWVMEKIVKENLSLKYLMLCSIWILELRGTMDLKLEHWTS